MNPVFESSSGIAGHPGYPERSGNTVEIVRELTADEFDQHEVGRMFRIRFADGVETDAFEDELSEVPPGSSTYQPH